MALPLLPLALGAGALFFLTRKSSAYSQAPADGSRPPVKEAAPPAKTWQGMPAGLQEQVAAALGALGVSPATGELSGSPVTADAIKMATQTAALCESQGFYDVAKELRRLAEKAVVSVPTPPEAAAIKAAAPPGLTPAQVEAMARTLSLDRDPRVIQALLDTLSRLPASPQRDYLIQMAQALLLQLAAAQSTTQTLQQIDQVIKSPGIAEIHAAVQPLPPVAIPVVVPPAPRPPPIIMDKTLPDVTVTPGQPGSYPVFTYAALLPLTGKRLLRLKSNGEDVRAWQNILRLDGYSSTVVADKDFGAKTVAATKDWQKQRGLTGDGEVGPKTRAKVGTGPFVQKPAGQVDDSGLPTAPTVVLQPKPPIPGASTLVFAKVIDPTPTATVLSMSKRAAQKANPVLLQAVKSWQTILNALGTTPALTVDGDFGPGTDKATRALQQWAKNRYKDSKPIDVDGGVGAQTRRIVLARTAELKGIVIAGRAA